MGTHLQPKMVWSPLTATWRVCRLLQAVTSQFAALQQKYNCPFAKELTVMERTSLTNRKDPWAESKESKGLKRGTVEGRKTAVVETEV